MGVILKPFAMLLLFLYELFNSYGLALILFAVIVKLVLFPVTLKSKKSMIQTTMLSGQMQKLKAQYGKNPERYNMEVQKLYQKEKINPMGGCLWSLIPMFVLIGLFYIIQDPMINFMDLTAEQIASIAEYLNWETVAVSNGWVSEKLMADQASKLAAGEVASMFSDTGYNQLYLASLINEGNLSSIQALVGSQEVFVMNFSFLGLNLSAIPTWKFWADGISWNSIGLLLIPIISVIASFASMKVTMATNRVNQQTQNAQMDQTNKMMLWMMPIMSLWIGFSVPAGLSIYWISQYLISMIQEVICGKMLKKDYEKARIAAEEREREEKEEEKRRKEEARLERARRIEEEKNNKGTKKKAPKAEVEPEQEGVNKSDSREGIRAYARGRAYIPTRYGAVTEYTDPDKLISAMNAAEAAKKGKKGKAAKAAPAAEVETKETEIPVEEIAAPVEAPVETEMPAEVETEEVEVEVETIEVEVSEEENKEA